MADPNNAGQSLIGSIDDDINLRLKVTGIADDAIRVSSFVAQDRLSSLFRYTIVVATDPNDVAALDDVRGSAATFSVERDGKVERIVHGIITSVAPDGAYVGKRLVRTTLVLEPRLANLRHGGRFKISQGKSIRDIVEDLLKPERIAVDWRVHPVPPVRDYRTQQNESAYDFICRFAADEGLHFYFEHDKDKTTLVFTNDPRGYTEMAGTSTLDFQDTAGAVDGEHVRSVTRVQRVRTGAVEHRDYDFVNPRFTLTARAETGDPQNETNSKRRELQDYPGGFTDPDAEGTPRAKMRLEELRSDAFTLDGAASTLRLAVGKQFTLKGHRDKQFNRKLLVTEVSFGATVSGAFAESADGPGGKRAAPSLVKFHAVPAETPLRPARRPKPPGHPRIARVVGPADGDPFDDEYGRFRVQFVWDHEGKNDEHSSCWVRTLTPVAHGDEGFWSAHKVGSEVLVGFIDGDIDRPIILGAVYNGKERQAVKQPDKSSRTSLKVRGVPGGTGYNEIAFECSSGSEEIILHAQKDLNETILNCHTETIGKDQTSHVTAQQTITVGGDRSLTVTKSETISIGTDETKTIGNNETRVVGVNRTTTVTSDESLTVLGSATKMVAIADTVMVGAARSLTAGSETVTVGMRVKSVLGTEKTTVGSSRTETVGGAEQVTIGGQRSVTVTGPESLQAEKTIAITAKEAYQLQVGDDAMISLNKDGEILLKAGESSILLKKSGDIEIKGKNVIVEASSDATLKGDNVTVKGSKVAVN